MVGTVAANLSAFFMLISSLETFHTDLGLQTVLPELSTACTGEDVLTRFWLMLSTSVPLPNSANSV